MSIKSWLRSIRSFFTIPNFEVTQQIINGAESKQAVLNKGHDILLLRDPPEWMMVPVKGLHWKHHKDEVRGLYWGQSHWLSLEHRNIKRRIVGRCGNFFLLKIEDWERFYAK